MVLALRWETLGAQAVVNRFVDMNSSAPQMEGWSMTWFVFCGICLGGCGICLLSYSSISIVPASLINYFLTVSDVDGNGGRKVKLWMK